MKKITNLFKNIFKTDKMKKQTKARTLKVMKQKPVKGTKKTNDRKHKAMKPGLRISKTGNIYTERRSNRSDKTPKKRI